MNDGVRIYTDGSCLSNPGPGGWAWLEVEGDRRGSGAEPSTTNQRMELTAVIKGLTEIPGDVDVYSDSLYVVNCFVQRWWVKWRATGFRNSQGKPVANRDLWELLFKEVLDSDRAVKFVWVKGHASDRHNVEVDAMANGAATEMAARLRSGQRER